MDKSKNNLHLASIAPCLLAIIVDALGFGLVYPVMTAIFTSPASTLLSANTSAELRHFYLGLSYMLYPLCMFFGSSFMGDMSDTYGRKKVLMVCMGGIALSFFIMALSVTFASLRGLLLGRALSGLMAGSQPIAQAAITDLSSAATKAKNLSIIALSYCVGSVLGPLLGGVTADQNLVAWFSFATPFYLAGVFALIALIWIKTAFHETYQNANKRYLAISAMVVRPITIFLEAFADKVVCRLAIIFLLMQIGFSIYFQFITVQMRMDYAYSNWQLGAVQGMIGLGFALGLLVGMPFSLSRWSIVRIAVVAGIVTGVGQILAAFSPWAYSQWLLAIGIAAFNIMVFTAMLTLFSNAVASTAQGWVMGIANAVMALSWAITGLLANLLTLLGTRGLLLSGGICLVVAALVLTRRSPHAKEVLS